MLKIILPSLFLLIFLGLFIFTLFSNKNNKISILTYPYEYFISQSDENKVSIPLFIDVYNSPLIDKNNIIKCELICPIENEQFEIIISSIDFLLETTYENNDYYEYKVSIIIPFKIENIFKLENVYLRFSYENLDKLELQIGNIIIYQESDNELLYTNLKGVTTKVNNEIILYGIMINLKNSIPYIIRNIETLSIKTSIDKDSSKKITKDEFLNKEDNDKLIDYQIIGEGGGNVNIQMNGNDYIMIYLKYDSYEEVPINGIIIEYEENGIIKNKIINPFCFFQTSKKYEEVKEYIYEYN